jgi:hypothetical protein
MILVFCCTVAILNPVGFGWFIYGREFTYISERLEMADGHPTAGYHSCERERLNWCLQLT